MKAHEAGALRALSHNGVHILDANPDDVPVPSFGPRLWCGRWGHLGADARANWNERSAVSGRL
jgi:hypothetical protein